jgi:hypothetical protein
MHGEFDIFWFDAGQLELNEPAVAGTVDVGGWPPIRLAIGLVLQED